MQMNAPSVNRYRKLSPMLYLIVSLVKPIWETSDFAHIQGLSPDNSFLDLSKWVLENMETEKLGLFLSLAWACWTIKEQSCPGERVPKCKDSHIWFY